MVPTIYPLETLHNSLSLRQVNAFLTALCRSCSVSHARSSSGTVGTGGLATCGAGRSVPPSTPQVLAEMGKLGTSRRMPAQSQPGLGAGGVAVGIHRCPEP